MRNTLPASESGCPRRRGSSFCNPSRITSTKNRVDGRNCKSVLEMPSWSLADFVCGDLVRVSERESAATTKRRFCSWQFGQGSERESAATTKRRFCLWRFGRGIGTRICGYEESLRCSRAALMAVASSDCREAAEEMESERSMPRSRRMRIISNSSIPLRSNSKRTLLI